MAYEQAEMTEIKKRITAQREMKAEEHRVKDERECRHSPKGQKGECIEEMLKRQEDLERQNESLKHEVATL